MHSYRILTALFLAASSPATWAHGSHPVVVQEGLLHLLTHHWPLFLATAIAVPLISALKRLRD